MNDTNALDRIYADLEEVSLQNMRKLCTALQDMRNPDSNKTVAFNIFAELYRIEAERLRIITMLKHKHFADAGRAAERLAATNKGLFGT